ncbi:hypothetical protein JKF63_07245 [Porcisia hertigi]|uniref:Uncharacterized protein n=1 Tax=Porcisia hertigi TaxID=2761500 RepID=A0A836LLA0_9TRYP|nr:hypothetical protein JKF63_07245 [Porcisia hertigi]
MSCASALAPPFIPPPFIPPPSSVVPNPRLRHTPTRTTALAARISPSGGRGRLRSHTHEKKNEMLPSLSTPLPSAAGAARSSAASTSTPAPSFSAFVLERVSRNPFMISETPRSQHPDLTSGDMTEDVATTPTTLDATQRLAIAQTSILGSAATSNPASALAVTAVLQRVLVDTPLLPIGGCHLLHEIVWPHFLCSAEAAKQVGCYRKALQLHDARQLLSNADSTASLQEQQAPRTETASSSTSDGELSKTKGRAAVDIFTASPLASSPADGQQWRGEGDGSSLSPGTASPLQTPEELSLTLTRSTLEARMEQARARLAASRKELQRGLTKIRRLLDGLRAYDAVPLAELARQQQETTRALFTPVAMRRMGDAPTKNGNSSSSCGVLAVDAAAVVMPQGAPVVLGEANAVVDRKRSREA